jgi:hypothetical protein
MQLSAHIGRIFRKRLVTVMMPMTGGRVMLKRIVWLVLAVLFVASVSINLLALGGCLDRRDLQREKDRIVERFNAQVSDLEARNRRLEESQRFLEARLRTFMATYASARAELARILDEYRQLKTEGD